MILLRLMSNDKTKSLAPETSSRILSGRGRKLNLEDKWLEKAMEGAIPFFSRKKYSAQADPTASAVGF